MVDIDGVWIPECYILDSGEKFWGGMKSKDDFKTKYNDLEVEVVDVEPQRMRGRWNELKPQAAGYWQCSACGFPSEAFASAQLYKFCPNCGADMRGGQNDCI
jgi:ribosomal protein L37AE/L43A